MFGIMLWSYLINIWFDRITYNNDWAQNYFIGKNDNDKNFWKIYFNDNIEQYK